MTVIVKAEVSNILTFSALLAESKKSLYLYQRAVWFLISESCNVCIIFYLHVCVM